MSLNFTFQPGFIRAIWERLRNAVLLVSAAALCNEPPVLNVSATMEMNQNGIT